MTTILLLTFVYLAGAVLIVPLAKQLGLGSVLGYLIVGIIIGPVLGLAGSESTELKGIGEFGVVMMLFLIGLEQDPRSLWNMKTRLLGLGGLQVAGSTLLLFLLAYINDAGWQQSLCIGLVFSLSSTAIVLQTLNEKGLTNTRGGQNCFSVLLFQDIAVIPMLALIPLLAVSPLSSTAPGENPHGLSLVANLSGWSHTLAVTGAIAVVVVAGHFLTRPLFRFIAHSHLREIFTAAALMLVIGISVLMSLVELSPALGTFVAGVILGSSEFRHELESDIAPFKGLLLGLFFISVGASIKFAILQEQAGFIIGMALAVMLIKGLVLLGLTFLFKINLADRWLLSLGLAQTGEFAFVLSYFSAQKNVLPAGLVPVLSLVITLSMLITPLLFIVYEKLILPHYAHKGAAPATPNDTVEKPSKIIIAGIGRFGQVVSRALSANGYQPVVLDLLPRHIDAMRLVNIRAYYGDATHPDLLASAGIAEAEVLVVAIDDQDKALELVHFVKRQYPEVTILARAYDRSHYFKLHSIGTDIITRETFEGALKLSRKALIALGMHPYQAEQRIKRFRNHEEHALDDMYIHWLKGNNLMENESFQASFISMAQKACEQMQDTRHAYQFQDDQGWAETHGGNESKQPPAS